MQAIVMANAPMLQEDWLVYEEDEDLQNLLGSLFLASCVGSYALGLTGCGDGCEAVWSAEPIGPVDQALVTRACEKFSAGVALGVASCLNHWLTNHRTGGKVLSGVTLKAWTTLDYSWPSEEDHDYQAKRKFITTAVYNIVHRFDARNTLYNMIKKTWLTCAKFNAWLPRPKYITPDRMFKFRTEHKPAGTKKVFVAKRALEITKTSKFMAFSPAIDQSQKTVILARHAEMKPWLNHVGGFWLTKPLEHNIQMSNHTINQTCDEVM